MMKFANAGRIAVHGIDAVLVAAELALESGKPSGEYVLNVFARLKSNTPVANLGKAMLLSSCVYL